MAGKLSARERAHVLANDEELCYAKPGARYHTGFCDRVTAAIAAHEDAVREDDADIVRFTFFPKTDAEHFVVMTAALNGAAATIMSKRSKEARQRDLDNIGARSLRSRGTP